jgi:hypothetical protein
MRHILIVAFVSLIDLIPDWAVFTLLTGKASLFHHISATDELDAQVKVEVLACADLHWDHLLHTLQIALVPIHNCHAVVHVQVVSHLLAEGLNACLDKGLLSIDIKATVARVGDFREVLNSA